VKRFGARYGRRIRQKLGMIEAQSRAKHACPYCSYKAVRKTSVGIFSCGKCHAKFASDAYAPVQKRRAATPVEAPEEPEAEEEELTEDG
jgi:ribosomal protein eL43